MCVCLCVCLCVLEGGGSPSRRARRRTSAWRCRRSAGVSSPQRTSDSALSRALCVLAVRRSEQALCFRGHAQFRSVRTADRKWVYPGTHRTQCGHLRHAFSHTRAGLRPFQYTPSYATAQHQVEHGWRRRAIQRTRVELVHAQIVNGLPRGQHGVVSSSTERKTRQPLSVDPVASSHARAGLRPIQYTQRSATAQHQVQHGWRRLVTRRTRVELVHAQILNFLPRGQRGVVSSSTERAA